MSVPDVITIDYLLEQQKTIVLEAGYTGLVLIDEQFIKNDEGFYSLFTGQRDFNDGHGILIACVGFIQIDDKIDGPLVKFRFAYEWVHPYDSRIIANKNSHVRFRDEITDVRRTFNLRENRSLKSGTNKIRHQLLQANVDWVVRNWAGPNAAKVTHYASMELIVDVRDKTCPTT